MTKALTGRVIGFIGLGAMGSAMVHHLIDAGAELFLWNRNRCKLADFEASGVHICRSAKDLAEKIGANPVIINVSDTEAVHEVIFSENGLETGLKSGATLVDMGTTQVMDTRRFAEELKSRGVSYVDAPVSGGEVGAKAATLTIMVGASDEDFESVRPIFNQLGQHVTHVGDIGAGQVAKSANQMIVGMTIQAISEALAMSKDAGVEPSAVREAIRGGFAESRILDLHGGRMVEAAFSPGAKLTIQAKDMRQAVALANASHSDLPFLQKACDLWGKAENSAWCDSDHSAYFAWLTKG